MPSHRLLPPSWQSLPTNAASLPGAGDAVVATWSAAPGRVAAKAAAGAPSANRRSCVIAMVATALLVGGGQPGPAAAQAITDTPRRIPDKAVLGTLNIGVFPQASVNGRSVTLAPGFRLLDRDSRIVVPSTVSGKNLLVAYLLGPVGEVITAWLPTESELVAIRRRPAGGR